MSMMAEYLQEILLAIQKMHVLTSSQVEKLYVNRLECTELANMLVEMREHLQLEEMAESCLFALDSSWLCVRELYCVVMRVSSLVHQCANIEKWIFATVMLADNAEELLEILTDLDRWNGELYLAMEEAMNKYSVVFEGNEVFNNSTLRKYTGFLEFKEKHTDRVLKVDKLQLIKQIEDQLCRGYADSPHLGVHYEEEWTLFTNLFTNLLQRLKAQSSGVDREVGDIALAKGSHEVVPDWDHCMLWQDPWLMRSLQAPVDMWLMKLLEEPLGNEAKILTSLCHPHIEPLLYCSDSKSRFYLFSRFSTSLRTHLYKYNKDTSSGFPLHLAVDIMIQIARAVLYLHCNGVAHLGLNCENFDVSSILGSHICDDGPYVQIRLWTLKRNNIGTSRYQAPEYFADSDEMPTNLAERDPFKADVHGFAMTCYELVTGSIPYAQIADAELYDAVVVNQARPKLSIRCPEKLTALIEKCWDPTPSKRPPFEQICDELMEIQVWLTRRGIMDDLDLYCRHAFYAKREKDQINVNTRETIEETLDLEDNMANEIVDLFERSKALLEDGDFQGALGEFDKAHELDPKNIIIIQGRVNFKWILNDFSGVLYDLLKVIALDPENGEGLEELGFAKVLLGDVAGAIIHLDKSITIRPHSACAFYYRGLARMSLQNWQSALEDLNEADRLDPNSVDVLVRRAELKLMLWDMDGALNDLDKVDVQEAAERDTYGEFFLLRGMAKEHMLDTEGAMDDYNEAVLFNPSDIFTLRRLAHLKVKVVKFEGALKDLNKIIESGAHCPEDLIVRSELKRKLGDSKGADDDLKSLWAYCLSPHALETNIHLRTVSLGRRWYLLDESLRSRNTHALALYFGYSGFRKGLAHNFNGALRDLNLACKLSPSEALFISWRRIVKWMMGDEVGRREDLQHVVELDVGSDVRNILHRASFRILVNDHLGVQDDINFITNFLNPNDSVQLYMRALLRKCSKLSSFQTLQSSLKDLDIAAGRSDCYTANKSELASSSNEGVGAASTSPSTTEFFSASRELSLEIERSVPHWTMLSELPSRRTREELAEENRRTFRRLKEHPEYGAFFSQHDPTPLGPPFIDLVLGKKLAEGGQAEIYEVIGESSSKSAFVAKVYKNEIPLRYQQSQWPVGLQMHFNLEEYWGAEHACKILSGGLLEDGRLAFVMDRHWGDLRTLIDYQMQQSKDEQGPPFDDATALKIMCLIALGMNDLKYKGMLHRDLKAANVLVSHEEGADLDPRDGDLNQITCQVADFESSRGVVGTRFWRAPEILEAMEALKRGDEVDVFSEKSDVYSYAMTCYEVLTGRTPMENHRNTDYDVIFKGGRPELPYNVDERLRTLLNKCWHSDPHLRPTFDDILDEGIIAEVAKSLGFHRSQGYHFFLPSCSGHDIEDYQSDSEG